MIPNIRIITDGINQNSAHSFQLISSCIFSPLQIVITMNNIASTSPYSKHSPTVIAHFSQIPNNLSHISAPSAPGVSIEGKRLEIKSPHIVIIV
jgi:hypothetical protein